MKKKTEKGLQKLSDLEKIFEKEQITPDDLRPLSDNQLLKFIKLARTKLSNAEGKELDRLFKQVGFILTQDDKNSMWQWNHCRIINTIHKLIQDYNRMPKISEIAVESKISRQTVTKHLKEFSTHELFQTEIDKYHIMLCNLMDKLLLDGIQNWNVKAIRLYHEILTYKTQNLNRNITNQNNYIQINNTKIDKVIIDNLPPEAKTEIERIILKTQNKILRSIRR